MRAKQRANLIAKILSGQAKCDCNSPATRFDAAGNPECQRCHDLNSSAMQHHERTQKEINVLCWEMNWV